MKRHRDRERLFKFLSRLTLIHLVFFVLFWVFLFSLIGAVREKEQRGGGREGKSSRRKR